MDSSQLPTTVEECKKMCLFYKEFIESTTNVRLREAAYEMLDHLRYRLTHKCPEICASKDDFIFIYSYEAKFPHMKMGPQPGELATQCALDDTTLLEWSSELKTFYSDLDRDSISTCLEQCSSVNELVTSLEEVTGLHTSYIPCEQTAGERIVVSPLSVATVSEISVFYAPGCVVLKQNGQRISVKISVDRKTFASRLKEGSLQPSDIRKIIYAKRLPTTLQGRALDNLNPLDSSSVESLVESLNAIHSRWTDRASLQDKSRQRDTLNWIGRLQSWLDTG